MLANVLGRSSSSVSACLDFDEKGKDEAVVSLRVVMERTIAKQISPPECRMYLFALATACAAVLFVCLFVCFN